MERKLYFKNLYVPCNNDWVNMGISQEYIPTNEESVRKCIRFESTDDSKAIEYLCMIAEIRCAVLQYYLGSESAFWKPEPNDTVHHVVTPDQSAIRELCVREDKCAPEQYNYTGNCYKTSKEAEDCKSAIIRILEKHHISVNVSEVNR